VDLPELDLPPGDYRERKPKGWRWKLHPDHDDDNWTPLIVFALLLVAGWYVYSRINEFTDHALSYAAGGMIGFGLGAMFMLWTRR
jgi:hypothetical protein